MLHLRVQFLQGTYQASDPMRGLQVAEWPPHPARIHAAMIAAAWSAGDGLQIAPAAAEALVRLEGLGPPVIAVPAAATRSEATAFVPRNPVNAELGRYRRGIRKGKPPGVVPERGPRSFPTTVPGDAPIFFSWAGDLAGTERATLASLAEQIAYLGSSRSPVCCDVVDEAPAPTLSPLDGPGTVALRVPTPGFTEATLRERFTFPPAVATASVSYARPAPPIPSPAAGGPFAELLVARFARPGGVSLPHAPVLTRALRRAVLAQAGDTAPEVLHGHAPGPHVAFLALPDVGHPHATGTLRGVALALPRDIDVRDRTAVRDAFHAVETLRLARSRPPVELAVGGELRALSPARWIGPARRWRTVTPIVADRHPKPSHGGLEGALRLALAHAGLPEPAEVTPLAGPGLTGVAVAGALRGEVPRGLRLHVQLLFQHAVAGPVLVGRGRYFGIGMLAPCD